VQKERKTMDYKNIVKESMTGLIGDGYRLVEVEILYNRVKDISDKYGVYSPSWAKYIETLRELNYAIGAFVSDELNTQYVELPTIEKRENINLHKQIAELQEKLDNLQKICDNGREAYLEQVDKLHRRNLLVRDKDKKVKKLQVLLGYFSPQEIADAKYRMNNSNINYNR
jgi:hypothetical protein